MHNKTLGILITLAALAAALALLIASLTRDPYTLQQYEQARAAAKATIQKPEAAK